MIDSELNVILSAAPVGERAIVWTSSVTVAAVSFVGMTVSTFTVVGVTMVRF